MTVRTSIPSLTFAAVCLLAAGCTTAEAPLDTTADSIAIHDLIRRTADANNRGDVDAWVGFFERDAVYMPPGSPEVRGPSGLREIAEAGFTQFQAAIDISPSEIVVMGDWAFARSQVTGHVTPVGGGDSITVDVKQLVLYHQQPDGTWRIARLINNSNRE